MSLNKFAAFAAAKKEQANGTVSNPAQSDSVSEHDGADSGNPAGTSTRADDDSRSNESQPGTASPAPRPGAGIKFGNPFGRNASNSANGVTGAAIQPSGAVPARSGAAAAVKRVGADIAPTNESRAAGAGDVSGRHDDGLLGNLAGLAELDVSNIGAALSSDVSAPNLSAFADETPIERPVRDIAVTNMVIESIVTPEEGEAALAKTQANVASFIAMMDSVHEVMADPELAANVVGNIMTELQMQPQYKQLIRPQDALAWVRSMRRARGVAVIKKTETKAKRSESKSKKVAAMEDMDALAASLGINF